MAVPTVPGQGADNSGTTAAVTYTLPSHQANDHPALCRRNEPHHWLDYRNLGLGAHHEQPPRAGLQRHVAQRVLEAGGWCQPHYQRWWRNGDPLTGRYVHRCRAPRPCAVKGCRRRHCSNGFCELHYLRWVKSGGDMEIVTLKGPRPSVLNGKWGGDDVGYDANHGRLNRARGYAREHSCAKCDESAVDWAYDHSCPNEKAEERRGRVYVYSADLARYSPLCRSCHTRLDKGLDN